MRQIQHELGTINVLEQGDSTDAAVALLHSRAPLSVDTESTGLKIYHAGYATRLVQMGTFDEAYVWQPDHFRQLTYDAVTTRPWFAHNATHDQLTIERTHGIPFSETARYAIDTGILSRLLDQRNRDKGGTGHSLENLMPHYLGIDAKHSSSKALEEEGAKYGFTKDTLWAGLPTDNEVYLTYAGLDVLQTSRLGALLLKKVREAGLGWLCEWEHKVSYCLAHLKRRGMRLDVDYVTEHRERFLSEFQAGERELAERWQIKPTSSGRYSTAKADLIRRFEDLGVKLTKLTPAGKLSLDKHVLARIAAYEDDAAELAKLVRRTGKAEDYATYLKGYLDAVGEDGRVHADLNPMGASTGRNSMSKPNLQNVPKDDPALRGGFVADVTSLLDNIPEDLDEEVFTADYAQVEYRVAAALSRDPNMLDTIARGESPHKTTARGVYGDDYTPAQYDLGKIGVFSWIYGSGADALSEQLGISKAEATTLKTGFERAYPTLARLRRDLGKKLEASGSNKFLSPTGRHLIADRAHKVLNYEVQGPARDLLMNAVVRMFDAGIGDYLRLLVHDEVVGSAPKKDMKEIMRVVQECMTTEFKGVPIVTEAEIKGPRWQK